MGIIEKLKDVCYLVFDTKTKMVDKHFENIQDKIKFSSWVVVFTSVFLSYLISIPKPIFGIEISARILEISAFMSCLSIFSCVIFYLIGINFLENLRRLQTINLIHKFEFAQKAEENIKLVGDEKLDNTMIPVYEIQLFDMIEKRVLLRPEDSKEYEEINKKVSKLFKIIGIIMQAQLISSLLSFAPFAFFIIYKISTLYLAHHPI